METLLTNISNVTTTVTDTAGSFATLVTEQPLLLLFCVGLPVVSFGAGMLLMLFHRGR